MPFPIRRSERGFMGDVRSERARLEPPRGPSGRRVAALIAAFLTLLLLSLGPAGAAAQQAGGTPSAATQMLFEAVLDNDLDAVKAALAEGADTRARDNQGRMPAGLAVDKGYFEIAHYILTAQKAQRDKARQAAAAAPPPPPPAACTWGYAASADRRRRARRRRGRLGGQEDRDRGTAGRWGRRPRDRTNRKRRTAGPARRRVEGRARRDCRTVGR